MTKSTRGVGLGSTSYVLSSATAALDHPRTMITGSLALRVGRGIAERRKLLGLTQEALAARIGVTFESISRIERGVALPTLLRLDSIATAMGTDAAVFLRPPEKPVGTRQRALARIDTLLSGRSSRELDLIADVVARILRG